VCEYSGTDNLEVMAEAVNYNKFLLTLIFSYAKRGDRIVDFGAGIGTFARELAQNGYRVHCIEPDTRQAQVITAAGLSVSASLEEVEDESVDYLYSLNVL
jgi:2-polyprenyl-3-methyl-5-hydroxy-6-metoxy-1,4-benzoquinol methylase